MITRRGNKKGALAKAIGAALLVVIFVLQGAFALGGTPWPEPPAGQDPSRFGDYCRSDSAPGDYDAAAEDGWQLSGGESDNPYLSALRSVDPGLFERELRGVAGASVDRAWSVTTGRPDVVIAVLDSGIRWHDSAAMSDLANKVYVNHGEVPPPQGATTWDANGDGVFNAGDYAGDPRVADANANGILDPQDLIRAFSDGVDGDGNGYVDDVSGWDFLEDDNDPWDETDHGQGTAACRLSCAEAGNGSGTPGACPNAMALVVRLGDPARVDANEFAQGLIFAVDSGADVAQAAVASWNNTSLCQTAIDYAWARGVTVVASAGEGGSAASAYPGACERTVQVSALDAYRATALPAAEQSPSSYLYLEGGAGYGPNTAVSCPSGDGSSGAVGRTAGIAGLLYSAAMDKVERGELWLYPGTDEPLSACEVKQLLSMTADDIDFSPDGYGASFGSLDAAIGPSGRYQCDVGWDAYTGYGRVNAYEAARAVSEGRIPPEAEIRSPRWSELVNPGQVWLEINARVAAVRADSFQYTVEWGPGSDPSEGDWRALENSDTCFGVVEGVVATLDLGEVYRALQEAAQTREAAADPDRFAFTIRVRVRDEAGNWGEDRKTLFCLDDPDAYPGAPVRMEAGVSGSPRFADLEGDGEEELIVATDDGLVHALRRDLRELEGWPVHTTSLDLHLDSAAFRTGALPSWAYASVTGAPAVGDLDHDGSLEVVAADSEGRIYAWNGEGGLLPGFPVRSNPVYSIPDRADWWTEGALPAEWQAARMIPDSVHRLDRWNRLDKHFPGGPALSNLDGSKDGSLEIVAACADQHLYAWHADGRLVGGWPVKLADPARVSQLDPLTHACRYADAANASAGSGISSAPAVADLDGDCSLEVVCASGEFYPGTPAVSTRGFGLAILLDIIGRFLDGAKWVSPAGSGRVYAVQSDGTAHGVDPSQPPASDRVPANAYEPGWPAGLAAAGAGLLGGESGICGQPAVADVDGDGRMETAVAAAGGPPFLLEPDGSSHLGSDELGRPLSLGCDRLGAGSGCGDAPVASASGGGCFAFMEGYGLCYLAPTAGIGVFLDLMLPGDQAASEWQVSAWNAEDGAMLPSFPTELSGAMLFSSPAAADVDGDGLLEALAASSYRDIRALETVGGKSAGWSRFTGGWSVGTPCAGGFGGGEGEVAVGTREGWLLVWKTAAPAGQAAGWTQGGHDAWNTGWLDADASAPGRVGDLAAKVVMEGDQPVGLRLAWTAPGDDGGAGQALCYEIRYLDRPIGPEDWDQALPLENKPLPGPAGSAQEMTVAGPPLDAAREGRALYFAMRTRDEAGNISALSNTCEIPR